MRSPRSGSAVRIAHLSDLHYAPKTLTEVDRCVSFAVDHILDAEVDAVVISGDSTDHALDAHSPALLALLKQVRRLTDAYPLLVLQGTTSHDPPGLLPVMELLGGRFSMCVANRIAQVALNASGQWMSSPEWCLKRDALPPETVCVFSCLPSMNRAVITGPTGHAMHAPTYAQAIDRVLQGFGVINAELRERGIPTVGVSHGTVNGCVTEHGVPMASLDHEFSVGGLFSAQGSAFLLGHIHRHQAWEQAGRRIAYAGSPARLHFGEEGDKGFLLWEVDAATAEFEFVRTPARRMLHFDFTGPPDLQALREQVDAAHGASVRIRWTVPEEARRTVDRGALIDLFAQAATLKLEERIEPVTRTRAAGIAHASTVTEKLKRWAQVSHVDPDPLLTRLQLLLAYAPEDTALNILERIHDERPTSTQDCHDPAETLP